MAQSVKHPTSAQIMISQFVSLSPALGSALSAQSLLRAYLRCSVSLSLCPSPGSTRTCVCACALPLALSLSLSKINVKKKRTREMQGFTLEEKEVYKNHKIKRIFIVIWGKEETRSCCLKGTELQFCKVKKFSRLAIQQCEYADYY